MTIEILKIRTTLLYFNNRLLKLNGHNSIGSIQTIRARIKRFNKRVYSLNFDIREHRIYTKRTLRLYHALKSNGLFLMDNEMLKKFPFERMRIGKGGNITFQSATQIK